MQVNKITGLVALALAVAVWKVEAADFEPKDFLKYQEAFKNANPKTKAEVADDKDAGKLFASLERFKHHNADLWTGLTSAHYEHIKTKFGELKDAGADIWKSILPADIRAIQQDPVNCKVLTAAAFNDFGEKTMQEVNWPCLEEVLNGIKVEQLKELNEDTCKSEGMERIVDKAEKASGKAGIIPLLSLPCVKAIFEHGTEAAWRKIQVVNLKNEGSKRSEKLGSFTHSAVAAMKLEDAPIEANTLRDMKADVFASIASEIHADTFAAMQAEKVEKFGSLRTDFEKCKNLNPAKVASPKKLDPSCFASYLRNTEKPASSASIVGTNLSNFNNGILSKIEEASEFEKFVAGDFDGMSSEQLASMVQTFPEACQHVTAESDAFCKKFSPSAKCFGYLPSPLKAKMLETHSGRLPEDVLAYLTNDDMPTLKGKDGKVGVAFLDSAKLSVKYLHLGSHVEAHQHPCLSISSSKSFVAMKNLSSNIGPHCYQALTFMADPAFEKEKFKFPDTVYALSPVSEILEKAPSFFKTLTATTFRLAASGDHFCASVDQSIMSTIPPAAFGGMTFDCLAKMKTNAKFISVAQLNVVPADVFAMVDAEVAKNLVPLTNLAAPQLKKLSTGVKDAAKSAFTLIGAADMTKLTAPQLASLDAGQLAAIPADAFAGLESAEQIKAIPAAAWTKVVFEQVKSIKVELLILLPADSIRNLSKDVTDKTKKAGRIYTPDLIALLPAESVAAANEVSGNGASTIKASVAAIAIAAVATLLLC